MLPGMDQDRAEQHITRAWVLTRLGRPAEALAACEAALLADGSAATRVAVAEALREAGAAPRARAVLEAAKADHPGDRGIDHLLGQILLAGGDTAGGEAHLRAALAEWPDAMPGLLVLTLHLLADRRADEVLPLWQAAVSAAPDPVALAGTGANCLAQAGHAGLARSCAALADPGPGAGPVVAYSRAAALGESAARQAPPGYVAELFDRFAESYDAVLARLGNTGPQVVAQVLAEGGLAAGSGLRVLDAGCGTGLCGAALRPLAARLTGVDLSAAMLALAAETGWYDRLVQADLAALAGPDQAGLPRDEVFDLIVSSDVLVYFGDLSGVLAALRARLARNGTLVLTLEAADHPGDEGFLRHPSGRFRHHPAQVAEALTAAGFHDARAWTGGSLRQEFGRAVPALIALARG